MRSLRIIGNGSTKITKSERVFIEEVKKLTTIMFQHPCGLLAVYKAYHGVGNEPLGNSVDPMQRALECTERLQPMWQVSERFLLDEDKTHEYRE